MTIYMLSYLLPREFKMNFDEESNTLYINETIKVFELKLIRKAIKNLKLEVKNIIIES